ncbi:transcription factor [Venturia nashicola]|nr:transcription factor [Venturia nashicola]
MVNDQLRDTRVYLPSHLRRTESEIHSTAEQLTTQWSRHSKAKSVLAYTEAHMGNAIVRPYTHQGRDGFLVTTAGPPLTKEQIDDLKEASVEYELRQAERMCENQNSNWFVNQPVAVGSRPRRHA